MNQPDQKSPSNRRYFGQPDQEEKPLSLWETLCIVVASHLGVRTKQKQQEDFRRANGLHLFVAGLFYFALIIAGLIALVTHISR